MNDLVDEFVTFFFAGHDTTAIILSFMLENVLRHPDVKEKTLDEVIKVLSNRDDVEYKDLNQLDYIGSGGLSAGLAGNQGSPHQRDQNLFTCGRRSRP